VLKLIGKFIRGQHDWAEGFFHKGGKLERLYPLYEAHDTFLFTPGETTKGSTHVRDAIDLKRMMSIVVVALIPCIFMALYNTGFQANLIYATALEKMQEQQGASFDLEAAKQTLRLTPPEDATTSDYLVRLVTGNKSLPNWRMLVLDYFDFDWTDAGTFSGNFLSPGHLLKSLLHGALFFFPVWFVGLAAGGLCEAFFAIVRRHEINEGFLVTSTLFPLTLPADIPLWQVALGIIFGVVVGKEIFGGTGKNFLNPALTARAFLYFNNAPYISGDNVWTAVDGYSGATGLGALAVKGTGGDVAATLGSLQGSVAGQVIDKPLYWWDAFVGNMHGSMGETSTLACLIGAVILIASGIGSWRIMAGTVIGMAGFSFLLSQVSTDTAIYAATPLWHLVLGGFAFGAVFMATDPVSASMTETGKWIYGLLIGFMTVVVRALNPGYAEGIMLAILFANCCAPLIDYFVVQANISRRLARNAA
jgi:Na+-transporting NADH:ubiquinone oxidoreductase subunit B